MSTGEKAQILDAKSPAPRFEPKKTGWATLPVQPPSGAWQQRSVRVLPALIANLVLGFAAAFTAHRNSATWALFSILIAGVMLLGTIYFVVGIRGAQLERCELKQ